MLVAGLDRGLELVEGEIGGAQAGVEVARAEVDGVGALAEGGVEGLGIARGGKELYCGHGDTISNFRYLAKYGRRMARGVGPPTSAGKP